MVNTLNEIKRRMNELEILIEETKSRLPAHSTKPPVMMDLLDYEDEYDVLLDKYSRLKSEAS